ncbi:MAG TPA: (2Fe-2S)-binding protein, partial [Urbifossiella sp.]|nr:(2Fe-2S)-binding protein [Urbifossiella sp.]
MNPDDKVCLCFHVTRRKLVNWTRIHQPRVPSQIAACGGAGTGCGWCIPFLKQIFRQEMGTPAGDEPKLDEVTAEEYARGRAGHVAAGKGTPPPGGSPVDIHLEQPSPRGGGAGGAAETEAHPDTPA